MTTPIVPVDRGADARPNSTPHAPRRRRERTSGGGTPISGAGTPNKRHKSQHSAPSLWESIVAFRTSFGKGFNRVLDGAMMLFASLHRQVYAVANTKSCC